MSKINPKTIQIGGDHYQKYSISPLEKAEQWKLPPTLFSTFKYLVRYKDKNGLEDLKKALHCLDCYVSFGNSVDKILISCDFMDFFNQFEGSQKEAIFWTVMSATNKDTVDRVKPFIFDLMKPYMTEGHNESDS